MIEFKSKPWKMGEEKCDGFLGRRKKDKEFQRV
jgi:hypothetical protein